MNTPYQLSLPTELDSGGNLHRASHIGGLLPCLKASMRNALAAAVPPLSREQLVDRMNSIARIQAVKITSGRSRVLTLDVLEKWLASNNHDDKPGIEAFVVFMLALNNFEPLNALVALSGCSILPPEEMAVWKYGKAKLKAKETAKQVKLLEDTLEMQLRGIK